MNFKQVSIVNKERALLWHKGGLEEWTIADWSNAMCGEAGEVANAVKKYRRLEDGLQQKSGPQTFEEAKEAIAKEIGDVYLYLDLLAQVLGVDIEDAIVSTFNRVSEREGFPQRL
jgi:NTP pyrophosphatase (non-canonical NTP hydrolase)